METISNIWSNTIVTGTNDAYSIKNTGGDVTIQALDSNDSITNAYNKNVLIDGGAGDDYIENVSGASITLNGGTGNDTLTGGSQAEIFVYEAGNDVITNYSHEDTIKIASGSIDSVTVNDVDLIFHIGDGSLTLKDMQGRYITITDADDNTTTLPYGSTGYSQHEVIKNLVHIWNRTYLKDTAKLDESIKLSTHFNTIQEAIDQMVADCRAAGDAETFLRKYCGIIMDNADTGAITGWDAGGAAVKTADEVIGETLSTLKHVPDYTDTTFKTSQGVTINISSTGDSLTADGKKVLDGLYSWWADKALDLIEESYGVKFTDNDSINFSLVPSVNYWGQTAYWGQMGIANVKINMGSTYFYSDDDYNGNGADRCISHEFTHVAQNFFMGYFPQFLNEGLPELTYGIDDMRGWTISNLAGNADSLASFLDVNKMGTLESNYYAAGFMFYRYLARQAAFNYDSLSAHAWDADTLISGTDGDDSLTGSGKNQTISAGVGNDTLAAYGDATKVFGDAGDDSIFTNGEGISADGGLGNDTIYNRGTGSSLTGGDGNDTIDNRGDNVSINAGTGDDSIQNNNSEVTISCADGSDTVNNWGSNATIDGGAGNDSVKNGGNNISISGGDDDDTINNDGNNVSISAARATIPFTTTAQTSYFSTRWAMATMSFTVSIRRARFQSAAANILLKRVARILLSRSAKERFC